MLIDKSIIIAFKQQKQRAKQRGIEFNLTFEEWLDFWGEDISKRGKGKGQLQMQRFHDSGAYEIGNIKKGTAKDNAKTRGACRRLASAVRAKNNHESNLNRLMFEESKPDKDDAIECLNNIHREMHQSEFLTNSFFCADK